jgi:hypothetical protein
VKKNHELIFFFLLFVVGGQSLVQVTWAYDIKIQSVEMGGCWIGEEEGELKISLFSESSTLTFNAQDFAHMKESFQRLIPEKYSPFKGDIRVALYLYCQADRSQLFARVVQGPFSGCVQMTSGHLWWKTMHMYPYHQRPWGPCEGQAKGKLFISLGPSQEQPLQRQRCLQQIREEISVESLEEFKESVILHLKESSYLEEKEVKFRLLELSECAPLLHEEDIDYDDRRLPVGSFFLIWESKKGKISQVMKESRE